MYSKKSSSIFILSLLFISSFSYDVTYDDSASCQDLCTRDKGICDTWIYPYTEIPVQDCYDVVDTYCTDVCDTDPATAISCSRCNGYKTSLTPGNKGLEYFDAAFDGCLTECNCIQECSQDYMYCINHLDYEFSVGNCENIISSCCFQPCLNGYLPDRQTLVAIYQSYCYDTPAINDDSDCSNAVWPTSYV